MPFLPSVTRKTREKSINFFMKNVLFALFAGLVTHITVNIHTYSWTKKKSIISAHFVNKTIVYNKR